VLLVAVRIACHLMAAGALRDDRRRAAGVGLTMRVSKLPH
jgi:hypothetical protein